VPAGIEKMILWTSLGGGLSRDNQDGVGASIKMTRDHAASGRNRAFVSGETRAAMNRAVTMDHSVKQQRPRAYPANMGFLDQHKSRG
jgi:hypothetical protein